MNFKMEGQQQTKSEPLVFEVDDDSDDEHTQQDHSQNGETEDAMVSNMGEDGTMQGSELNATFREWGFSDNQMIGGVSEHSKDAPQIQFPMDGDWPSMVAPSGNAATHYHVSAADQKRVCKICLGRYSTDSALKSHMLVHTGERRHRCLFCNKWFKLKHHLHRHVLMHVRIHIRKYGGSLTCVGCQATFQQDVAMAKHMSHCHAIKTTSTGAKVSQNAEGFETFLGTLEEDTTAGQEVNRAPRLRQSQKQDSPIGKNLGSEVVSPTLPDGTEMLRNRRASSQDTSNQAFDDTCVSIIPALHSPSVGLASALASGGAVPSNSAYLQQTYNLASTSSGYVMPPTSQVTSSGGITQRIIGTNTITGNPIVESSQRSSRSPGACSTTLQVTSVRSLPCPKRTIGTQTIESGICSDQYTCPACNIDFKENALYLMHKTLHGPESPWQCSQCQESFPDKYGFMAHLLNRMSHN